MDILKACGRNSGVRQILHKSFGGQNIAIYYQQPGAEGGDLPKSATISTLLLAGRC